MDKQHVPDNCVMRCVLCGMRRPDQEEAWEPDIERKGRKMKESIETDLVGRFRDGISKSL